MLRIDKYATFAQDLAQNLKSRLEGQLRSWSPLHRAPKTFCIVLCTIHADDDAVGLNWCDLD